MGKPAAREGDISTGHGPFIPVAIKSGSGSVNINGVPAARKDDPFVDHVVGSTVHSCTVSVGSGTVNINGSPAARLTDDVSGGGKIALGSPTVNIGG